MVKLLMPLPLLVLIVPFDVNGEFDSNVEEAGGRETDLSSSGGWDNAAEVLAECVVEMDCIFSAEQDLVLFF